MATSVELNFSPSPEADADAPPIRSRRPSTWYCDGGQIPIKSGLSDFSHPFQDGFAADRKALQEYRCLEEKQIIAISKAIRQKPNWQEKYKNPEILAKWRAELLEQEPNEKIVDYALAELEFYDQARKNTGNKFTIGPIDYVYYGDNVVPQELKDTFKKAASVLEDMPDHKKDWHPGSNEQVLDLVHPSLYPYQYEITPVVPESKSVGLNAQYQDKGELKVAEPFDVYRDTIKSHFQSWAISKRFQWLPSLFDIDQDGKVTIKSYINNLHPEWHADLYQPIADIFACAIPGINASLTAYASPQRIRIDPFDHKNGLYDEDAPSDDDEWDEWFENRQPAPRTIEYKGLPTDTVNIDVRGKQLKVITKMANIELTPEKPTYAGGSWHVEGTINEDIVCTVIYYYDSENITTSELAYRVACAEPMYEQGDSNGMQVVYGLNDEDPMVWDVGATESIEDRIVVFPNMLQHRVQPFSLQDQTKPGHRKILCFFIVDPNNDRVVSTDKVPPQQADWWSERVRSAPSKLTSQLPKELLDQIIEAVEWPMSMEKAKEVREELMEERKRFDKLSHDYEGAFSDDRFFSLCEH